MANDFFFTSAATATTLSSGITNSVTSITVGAITGFPVSYPYLLIIDRDTASEEVVLVTAGGGTTLTVTRGYDSTTGLAHSAGASVVHGVSAKAFNDFYTHKAATGAVHGLAGTVVGTSDTQTLTNKTLTSPVLTTPDGVARGTLGYAQVVATESGFGAGPADVAGLSSTVTVGSGRRVRVSVVTRGSVTVAGDSFKLQIREGATELAYCEQYFQASFRGSTMIATVILTPTAGAHTYKASITRTSGTGGLDSNAAATNPAFIHVEDTGV